MDYGFVTEEWISADLVLSVIRLAAVDWVIFEISKFI